MNELGIQQYLSTAYHPQSQGAIERFHQAFKSMLSKYCRENEKEWDEGVPVMVFAIRDNCQDALGFCPFQLAGHDVRGPLTILKGSWVNNKIKIPLSVYVNKFKARLKRVGEIARENLSQAQLKMKGQYDQKCNCAEFNPGDQVLAFIPTHKNPLQAKFIGPYTIAKQQSPLNYVIATPGKRKSEQLVHLNRLKLYYTREAIVCAMEYQEPQEQEQDLLVEVPVKLCN
ncbi:uncharacterized protein LOC121870928 [Homarus americanus]|uniref:uncharacterized protein LOC121870928 n=1 Tax=Homarus americanus TaxID=6706 RepID=UPI001C467121|nr:uncharacterized protein LOC121870928 [Homarus americanus]